MAPFFGNETKVKIPSEIKPPLDCGSAYLVRNTNRTVWDFFLRTLIKQGRGNRGQGEPLVPQSLNMIQSKTYSLNEIILLLVPQIFGPSTGPVKKNSIACKGIKNEVQIVHCCLS